MIHTVIPFSHYNNWMGWMSTLFPLTKGNGAFCATPEQALRCASALLPYIKLCFLRSKSELDQRPECHSESTSICWHLLQLRSPGQNMITSLNIKIASGTQVDLRLYKNLGDPKRNKEWVYRVWINSGWNGLAVKSGKVIGISRQPPFYAIFHDWIKKGKSHWYVLSKSNFESSTFRKQRYYCPLSRKKPSVYQGSSCNVNLTFCWVCVGSKVKQLLEFIPNFSNFDILACLVKCHTYVFYKDLDVREK